MLRILIADDHVLFREGARHFLSQLDDNVEVIEAGGLDSALAKIDDPGGIDLILLDLTMPGMARGGEKFDGLKAIREHAPAIPVVILTASESRSDVQQTLDRGAMGYIPKSANADVILNALKLVLAGEIYLPPSLVYSGAGLARPKTAWGGTTAIEGATSLPPITRRQRDVLALLGQGKSNKVIADELGISEGTVKIHVGSILKALGATNRTQAALTAIEMGLSSAGR